MAAAAASPPQEVKHTFTKEDVDKFLANVLASEDIGAPDYYHEKLSVVAHRRLENHTFVPLGLINCMILLLNDLERGQDGYDSAAVMPKAPGIIVAIQPAMYVKLWKHLPEDFGAPFKNACEGLPVVPQGCSVM